MFESPEELEKIRRKALHLALAGKWLIVDAERPAEEVQAQIIEAVAERDRNHALKDPSIS